MSRTFLLVYLIGLVFLAIVFVPQVEVKTVISSQKVPREVVVNSYTMPIFIVQKTNEGNIKEFVRSKIDYPRYFLHIAIYSVITGLVFSLSLLKGME